MAEINNTLSNTLLSGTSGDDEINNGGWWNDSSHSGGSNVTINTGEGNDYVWNSGDSVTINTGAGNDYVDNYRGSDCTINTGEGNDSVYNSVWYCTINTGEGNDSVYNFWSKYCTINTGEGDDSVENNSDSVTINTGEGNDSVYNDAGDDCTINMGAGYDYVENYEGAKVTINTGAGNDSVENRGSKVTISGGKGNDTIINNCDSNLIPYDDNDGSNVIFKYAEGDGNDIIYGFNKNSTLSIGGGSYSTKKSGDNIIVTVVTGKISLMGAASLSAVNIVGENKPVDENKWTLSGTTAKYGKSDKTLITVSGIKSLDGISLSGKVVTVAKSSVNKKKITISGDGYTLKLDDDVPKPSTKKAAWNIDGTTATYKSSYKTAGYSLAKDNKSISYTEATTAEILATVTGIKSTKGLSVSGNVVTVKNSALNKEKVTISNGYTLKLADDVTKTENKKAAFSYSNGTATYKSSYKTAGYTLASNSKSISYSKATTAKDLATITGAKATKGLSISGKKITLKNSALNNKVTVSGSYEFNFASDYKKATITGSKNADTIAVNGSKVSINGGKGNDTIKIFGSSNTITGGAGSDVFIYNSGNNIITDYTSEDKISISGAANVTTSGKDVIFNEKLTIKGAADKTVTYYDTSGEHNYIYSNTPYKINAASTGITLSSSYSDKKFETETYGENIVTIDAIAATQGVDIMGNDKSNKIIGGNGNDTLEGLDGNDTLTGGKGADVFVYYDGEGKDVITDYEEKDTIQIASGTAQISTSGRNIIFKVGKGSITVKNAAKTGITYIDKDDFEHNSLNGKEMVKINDETATINKKYWKKSFEVDKYGEGLMNIDASATTGDIKITGNAQANQIISGSGNSTLIGGAGDDTYYGGDGANIYVYSNGDGKDLIYNYSAGDKISLESGTVSKATVKGDTVIFTVGKGKISLEGAAGKNITIIEDGESKTKIYKAKNDSNSAWFMADDDNFAVYDNQISSIVENSSVNYSVFKKEADLSASNSILPAVSYSGKKS